MSLSLEVSSDGRLRAQDERSGRKAEKNVPPETLARIAQLYSGVAAPTPGGSPSSCADCFIYDIQLTSGAQVSQVHADDTTLDSSGAADLIAYLIQLRDSTLKAAP